MGSSVWLSILQVAAGGSLVQIAIRFVAFIYKSISKPDQRKATVSADATSVETAADVLIMVRGELKEVRAQFALEKTAWDTERVTATQSLDNAAREVQRVHSDLARTRSDLSVAQTQLAELSGRVPGRHSPPSDPYGWRTGP